MIDSGYGIVHANAVPQWTVRPDVPPHFSTPLHIQGVRKQALLGPEHRVPSDAPLRLRAVVEDAEGIAEVVLEYRVNDGDVVTVPWVKTAGKTRVEIDQVWTMPVGLCQKSWIGQ